MNKKDFLQYHQKFTKDIIKSFYENDVQMHEIRNILFSDYVNELRNIKNQIDEHLNQNEI